MRTTILASLAAAPLCGAVHAQPPSGSRPSIGERAAADDRPSFVGDGVYFIRRDPAYRVHTAATDYVNREIFCHAAPGAWALPVGPVEDGWMHGQNDAGEPFSIELSLYVEIPAHDGDATGPGAATILLWEGVMSTECGSVAVWGWGAQLADGTREVVPWLVQVDQADAFDSHNWLLSVGGDGLRTTCALDDLALALVQKAHIDARDGIRKTDSRVKWTGAGCLALGIAGCLIGGPVGCLPGMACFGGAILGTLIWTDEAKSEWQHTMESICADAQWRADHPGEDSPYDDLKFDTPVWAPIPISLN